MSIKRIAEIVAVGMAAASIAYGGSVLADLRRDFGDHVADFQCVRCVTECHEFCAANDILPTDCDCAHCGRYCGGTYE